MNEKDKGHNRNYPPELSNGIYLGKDFFTEKISISSTPTLIKKSSFAWPYMIINPYPPGDSQVQYDIDVDISSSTDFPSIPVDCSGFEYAHVFFSPDYVTGIWDVHLICYRPYGTSGYSNYVQILFPNITDNLSSFYTLVGPFGIAKTLSLVFRQISAGTIQGTAGIYLKAFGGSSIESGAYKRNLYIGAENVSVNSGMPILPGGREMFILGENMSLYGIASTPLSIYIVKL